MYNGPEGSHFSCEFSQFNYDFSQFSCNLKITIELCQISQLICVRNHNWTLWKITTELWKITTELFQKSQLNWVKITTELCQKPQLNCEPSRPSYKCHNFVSFLWIFASLHVGSFMGLSGKPAGGCEVHCKLRWPTVTYRVPSQQAKGALFVIHSTGTILCSQRFSFLSFLNTRVESLSLAWDYPHWLFRFSKVKKPLSPV